MNKVDNIISDKNLDLLNYADSLRWELSENLHDSITESIFKDANQIASKSIISENNNLRTDWEISLDKIVTSRLLGFPIMFFLLAIVFWLTIQGANYPSGLIAEFLIDKIHPILKAASLSIGIPHFIDGLLIDGAYLAMAWVISVMLPPMAIFFPLFTLLEDFGYLPRVAFNMDKLFQKAGAHGKQALTMSMGFGCNAAGVIAARVIDSPRERLIAIITNNFSLCNGRWPTQILIASIFIGSLVPSHLASLASASAVVSIALLGIFLSLVTSWTLSKTILKGEASSFSLELPPYRP
ncbi:MAG: nucleoside recognition domain-containing protein, partial [Melioribacteraceae bacterium]